MASARIMEPKRRSAEKRLLSITPDHAFFGLAGVWFVALTLVGFWQTLYGRSVPEPLPAHLIVHGVLYSAWVLIFCVQTLLISTHRLRWHAALGVAAALLLLVMIPVGFYVVLVKTAAGLKSADEAGFNLSSLTLALGFGIAGIANRRRPPVHKRLMLFTTLVLTIAAADRVAGVLELAEVRPFRKLLALAPGIALLVYDVSMRRRIARLSLALLFLVWLVVWFIISDLVFLHPAGDTVIRALTGLVA